MKKIFSQCDFNQSGGICLHELVSVLRNLGYFPEYEEIRDAVEDCGLCPTGDSWEMDFDHLWRFVEAYRSREGFSKADVAELRETFDHADLTDNRKDGTLDAFNVGHMFIKLGL